MRRILLFFIPALISVFNAFSQKQCVTADYLIQQIRIHPGLNENSVAVDRFVEKNLSNKELVTSSAGTATASIPLIKIPVVVHILYNSATPKVSEPQVRSQIDVLNKDFRRLNNDTSKIPLQFKALVADCQIEFSLASKDPKGRSTNGIIWKKTNIQFFNIDDRIKYSSIGGDDGWDREKYLNIWVGQLAGGMVGYSSAPGCSAEIDGIVISYTAFGTMGTASVPYNKGKSTVHEIGHWLGLRHTWGDRYCGDDLIDDTPPQQSPTIGCPSGTVFSCSNAPAGNMYMNYMDLTNDDCSNMFTQGQKERMRLMFEPGGPRYVLLQSDGCTEGTFNDDEDPLPDPSIPESILFPNPAKDRITVTVRSSFSYNDPRIKIFNQLGQLVLSQKFISPSVNLIIPTLKAGIYFIRIDGIKETMKFVKE